MRFQVPQFIEIEDKIFGPLTIKQFIYIAGGGGLSFIIFRAIPWLMISVPLIMIVLAFSLALAFYKINNKTLVEMLQSATLYFFSSKLYLWNKKDKVPEKASAPTSSGSPAQIYVPKLSQSKLHDLTWSLDIKESLNPVTREEK
jgi:hypothetical protein